MHYLPLPHQRKPHSDPRYRAVALVALVSLLSWSVIICFGSFCAFASTESRLPNTLLPRDESPEIIINIPEFKLRYYVGARESFAADIAVGSQVSPTRLGEYTVAKKVKHPTWFPPDGRPAVPPGPSNPLGTRWIGLDKNGYGLHGTINPGSIGRAASLGCIRMRTEVVEKFFEMVSIGTKVRLVYERVITSGFISPEQAWVRVLTDIYRRDGSNLDNIPKDLVQSRIEETGMSELLSSVDATLFWKLIAISRGAKVYLPYRMNFILDDKAMEPGAVSYMGKRLVPLAPVAERYKMRLTYNKATNSVMLDGKPLAGAIVLAGRTYLSDVQLAENLGLACIWEPENKVLRCHKPQQMGTPTPERIAIPIIDVDEDTPDAYTIRVKGAILKHKAIEGSFGLMLPIRSVADALGIQIDYDKTTHRVWIAGMPGVSTERVELIDGRSYVPISDVMQILRVRVFRDDYTKYIDVKQSA